MDVRLSFRLLAGTVAVALAIIAFTGWQLWQARVARIEQAEIDTGNLVGTLEQHGVRTIEAADLALQGVIDRLEHAGGGGLDPVALHRQLVDETERLPQIAAIMVFDALGHAIHDSETVPGRLPGIADQRYFNLHRARADLGLNIDSGLVGTVTGSPAVILSRRVAAPDGGFGGVVVAALRLGYFQSFYDRIDVGPAGTIALWHADGTLLVRKPAIDAGARGVAEAPLFRAQLPQAPSGRYRTDDSSDGTPSGPSDGVVRLVGYSRIGASLPLVITVGKAIDDILAPWRRQVWIDGAIATGLTVLLIVLAWRLGRALERVDANQRRAVAAESRVRDAIESLSDGLLLWDAADRLVLVNPAVQRAEARRGSDRIAPLAIGATFEALIRRRVVSGVIAVASGTETAYIESRLALHRNPTGEPVEERHGGGDWTRVTERRTSDGGVVTIVTDITDLKRAEAEMRDANTRLGAQAEGVVAAAGELQQANREAESARIAAEAANRSKSEFLTTMSHELRTPLTAVLGFADVIINPIFGAETPEQFREYGGYIKASGEHLLLLINDMLDLAKVEAGKMELRETEASLDTVVHAVLAMTKERAHNQGVSVSWRSPLEPIVLRVDEIKLKQALINVVSNGIKFTPSHGRIVIDVETTPRTVDIRVADTGIGIKPEDIPKVFEPYTQIDSAVAQRHKGTGLGMPLTLGLMQLHGGTVLLESEVGIGTTVVLRLPADRLVPALAAAS
jgi:signal transduction histidine kinase